MSQQDYWKKLPDGTKIRWEDQACIVKHRKVRNGTASRLVNASTGIPVEA